jgi:SAM-dependent methyltransferase
VSDNPAGPPGGDASLVERLGEIDIYLFDQLLRGRITPEMRVLDAACGRGRNLVYLMRSGAEVFGVDTNPVDIREVRSLAARLAPELPVDNFRVERIQDLSFRSDSFDAVICCAVLHFAADEADFEAMLGELWRVLRPGGILFSRLASTIGIEDRVRHIEGRWHVLPDGTDRFLVDEDYLLGLTDRLGATLLDPVKTTNVQGLRCMTTWCLKKVPRPADG